MTCYRLCSPRRYYVQFVYENNDFLMIFIALVICCLRCRLQWEKLMLIVRASFWLLVFWVCIFIVEWFFKNGTLYYFPIIQKCQQFISLNSLFVCFCFVLFVLFFQTIEGGVVLQFNISNLVVNNYIHTVTVLVLSLFIPRFKKIIILPFLCV